MDGLIENFKKKKKKKSLIKPSSTFGRHSPISPPILEGCHGAQQFLHISVGLSFQVPTPKVPKVLFLNQSCLASC